MDVATVGRGFLFHARAGTSGIASASGWPLESSMGMFRLAARLASSYLEISGMFIASPGALHVTECPISLTVVDSRSRTARARFWGGKRKPRRTTLNNGYRKTPRMCLGLEAYFR
jgi:hypothetical protein